MGFRDSERFRKTYSYFRPRPRPTDTFDAQETIRGIDWKQSVRIASTTDVDVTLAIPPGSITTIDSGAGALTLADEDRILLKDQTNAAENGIYIWYASDYKLVRALDAIQDTLTSGAACYVEEGTHDQQVWFLTTVDPITVDSTNQVWSQIFGGLAGDDFFDSTTAGSIFTTGSAAFKGGESIDSPSDKGTDVFFYVSGSLNGVSSSLFGGRLKASGSITSLLGLSGSLTKLADGTSYLIAGTNITIASASNGAVTISSTGGGTPAAPANSVQFNSAGSFGGSSNFTYDTSSLYLTGSFSQGYDNNSAGVYSHAEGEKNKAIGDFSHAEGSYTQASGSYSHTEGALTVTSGAYSHAEGSSTITSGSFSHAEGFLTVASGTYSHAEGRGSKSIGQSSHAEGLATCAIGSDSHSEGKNSSASGGTSHAEGNATISDSSSSHSEGDRTISGMTMFSAPAGIDSSGIILLDSAYGNVVNEFIAGLYKVIIYDNNSKNLSSPSPSPNSIAIDGSNFDGTQTAVTASAYVSLYGQTNTQLYVKSPIGSMGIESSADQQFGAGSHAEGKYNISFGAGSHAEGYYTKTIGGYSHAEGESTEAIGDTSHSEGLESRAIGNYSHAEGRSSIAVGVASHSEGFGTIASGSYQHVQGKFNKRDNNFSLFVIGDGTGIADVDRSDILRVNSGSVGGQGSLQLTGSLYVSGTSTFDSQGRSVSQIGADVYFFVSGSSGSLGTSTRGVAAFGGDVIVSGSLKVGTGSVTITSNDVQFGGANTRIEKSSSDLKFYDSSNPSGVTLSSLAAGAGAPSYWTSPSNGLVNTTGSVSIQGDLTVNGTTVTVNTTNLEVKDAVIGLGFSSGTIAQTAGDRGFIAGLSGVDNATLLWKNASSEFVVGRTVSSATGSLPITLTNYSDFRAATVKSSGAQVTGSLYVSGSSTFDPQGRSTGQIGSDVFLFVSGSLNGANKSVFGGDVRVSGSINTNLLTASNANITTLVNTTATSSYFTVTNEFVLATDLLEVTGNIAVTNSVSASYLTGTYIRSQDIRANTLTGSLTKLFDGTSFIIAGNNLSVTSASNGAITIGTTIPQGGIVTASYFDSATNGAIFTTGSAAFRGSENITSPSSKGSDVFFYVSGSLNGTSRSLFGGDVRVSGSVNTNLLTASNANITTATSSYFTVTNEFVLATNVLEITGNLFVTNTMSSSFVTGTYIRSQDVRANTLTGSLTKLFDGTSYLIAGNNLSITTGSNGSVTIGTTAAQGSIVTASYFDSTTAGSIFTTGSAAFRGSENISSPSSKGTDVFFYVSGSLAGTNKSLFGGFVTVSGTMSASVGQFSQLTSSFFRVTDSFVSSADQLEITGTLIVTGSARVTGSLYATGASTFDSQGRSTSQIGSDVFFFVSGSLNGANKSVFGGDVRVSGSVNTNFLTASYLNVTNEFALSANVLEITGNLYVTQNVVASTVSASFLSGSLTRLSDGQSYLVAGNNVSIVSQSNGSVLISSTDTTGSTLWLDGGNKLRATGSVSIDSSGRFADAIGSDVFFFVSGSISGSGADDKRSVFGGDVRISGSLSQGFGTLARRLYSHAEGITTIASGVGSHSEGQNTVSEGSYSHAEGFNTITTGFFSHAEGGETTASGSRSHAEGRSTLAAGLASHAEGVHVTASAPYSHAEGYRTITNASANYSHTEGYETFAFGVACHAEGFFVTGWGNYSHAEGAYTTSSGSFSHAEGERTVALGYISHTEGYLTIASGSTSHAEGQYTLAGGIASHTEGNLTTASFGANYSHAEGTQTNAVGVGSHAEGLQTTANGQYSHTEGNNSLAASNYSHAEGEWTYAGGVASHAEGYYTRASGQGSHAEGHFVTSSANYSHAEGYNTVTIGTYSHAEGLFTISSGSYQHVQGKYNKRDNDFSLFVIGDGTGDSNANRSDIVRVNSGTVGGTGRVEVTGSFAATVGISGSLTRLTDGTSYLVAGTGIQITTASNGSVLIAAAGGGGGGDSFFSSTTNGSVFTTGSVAFRGGESSVDSPSDKGSDVFFYVSGSTDGTEKALFGGDLVVSGAVDLFGDSVEITGSLGILGTSTLNGLVTITNDLIVTGASSFDAQSRPASQIGTDVFFFVSGSISGSGVDDKKAVFGGDVRISGSLSQGSLTTASGNISHAEGYSTIANAEGAHAEGYQTKIKGIYSHTEGYRTRASGSYCHAEGDQTNAGYAYYYVSDVSPDATPGQSLIQIDTLVGDVTSQFVSPGHVLWDEGMGYDSTYVAASFDGTNTYVTASITRIDTGATVTSIDGSTGTLKIAGGVFNPIEDANAGSVSYAHAEGSFSTTLGDASHAEGAAITFGDYSHAEGALANTYASFSHAEGSYTSTHASGSHAEGEYTRTYGYFSHAEGSGSITVGSYSHAEGLGTISSGTYQHVGGKYNTRGNDFSLFVIGDGTGDEDVNRSDIVRINPGATLGFGQFQVTGSITVSGSYLLNVVSGTSNPTYNVGSWEHVVVFTTNNVTGVLPASAPVGAQIIFKEGTGLATVSGGQMLSSSAGRIDGSATFTMPSINYTSVAAIKIRTSPEQWIIV